MATKTLHNNNPTVNPFELLQVDEQPAEKRARPQTKKAGEPALKETPAEKGQRRAKAKAEKDKQQEEVKKQQEKEAALATLLGPLDGFQVQKGSQPKKTVDAEKKKTLNRDQFFEQKPNHEERSKKPKAPHSFPREVGANQMREFEKHQRDNQEKRRRDNQGENTNTRPPRHEGFDKHSGGKTPNKHFSKKDGQGGANWGNPVQDWNKATEATPLSGGEDIPAQQPNQAGWGDEGAVKPTKPAGEEGESEATPLSEKKNDAPVARPPAWDEVEGFGKMLLDEYQTTVAAQKEKALSELAGVKQTRSVETPVDLSKFSYKEVSDDKEKKGNKEKKAEKQKQQRSGQTQVEVSQHFDVRARGAGRGGAGRGRGGAGRGEAGRGDRREKPEGEQTEKPSTPKGERRGGFQGRGGRRVTNNPKNFPDLSAAKTPSK